MIKIVPYEESRHYPATIRLWRKIGWTPCPPEVLPDDGLVAEDADGRLIAYAGIYIIPGKIGYIDWSLADPETGMIRGRALFRILDGLIELARRNRCRFVYSTTKTEAWKRLLIRAGMSLAEQGADTFILSTRHEDVSFISD